MTDPRIPEPSAEGIIVSQLDVGRDRFLAEVVEQALRSGERTPEDFIRHFPPSVMMTALGDRADLRAKILVATVGLRPKMAMRKSAASAAEDLQLTLDEGETDAVTILAAFDPDDRVRFLPHAKLWSFVIEGEFWNRANDDVAFEQGRVLITYILERALVHELLSLREIVLPVAMKSVRSDLTAEILWDIVRTALEAKEPFSYEHFLEAVPIDTLTRHVPLWMFWEQIIAQQIVQRHNFSAGNSMSPPANDGGDDDWVDVSAHDTGVTIVDEEVLPAPEPDANIDPVDDSGPEVIIEGGESISPPPPKADMGDIFATDEVEVTVVDPRVANIIAMFRKSAGLQLRDVKDGADLRSVLLAALLEIDPEQYKPEQFVGAQDKLIAKALLRNLEASNPSVANDLRGLLSDLQVTSVIGLNPDPLARPAPSAPRSAPPRPPVKRR